MLATLVNCNKFGFVQSLRGSDIVIVTEIFGFLGYTTFTAYCHFTEATLLFPGLLILVLNKDGTNGHQKTRLHQ